MTDIVAVARGAGIANSEWVRDKAHFEKLLDRGFADGGPVLLAAKIDDQPGKVQTVRDPALIRSRFMKGLGTGRGGALDARAEARSSTKVNERRLELFRGIPSDRELKWQCVPRLTVSRANQRINILPCLEAVVVALHVF